MQLRAAAGVLVTQVFHTESHTQSCYTVRRWVLCWVLAKHTVAHEAQKYGKATSHSRLQHSRHVQGEMLAIAMFMLFKKPIATVLSSC